jgi:Protein of unknown function (DUF3298)
MFGDLRLLGPVAVAACALIGWGTATAGAQSACAELGGTVDPTQMCRGHTATPNYTMALSFPVDYRDQQPLTDFVTHQRDEFVSYTQAYPASDRPIPYSLDITGSAYRSGTPTSGTQSLVFDIENDTGLAHEGHPDTSYKAFNYDLSKNAPITFDTLFKPGTNPLAVLDPIVQRELEKRGHTITQPYNVLGAKSYQNFALTDDAVIFLFGQGVLLAEVDGPLEVSVPRTELAFLLA